MNKDELLMILAIELKKWPSVVAIKKHYDGWDWANGDFYPHLISHDKKHFITRDDWLATLHRVDQTTCTPEEDEAWKEMEVRMESKDCVMEEMHPVGSQWISEYECVVEVVGYYDDQVVCVEVETGDVAKHYPYNLSAMATPEQRAEDEAVEAMKHVLHQSPDVKKGMRELYARIRDGGIPGIEVKRGDV